MPPPPQQLPDELVEEVLLRLPPEKPAGLVRAGLVCTRWCRIVSDPGFRRRFREFHRRTPMLGMLCSLFNNLSWFIPTTGFCFPRANFPGIRVLDARHGRVLGKRGSDLVAWDPITDKVRELLPLPQMLDPWACPQICPSTAAVLCSAAGPCNHLDCYDGPFLVVFVCSNKYLDAVIYTYSSDAAAWSEPVVCTQQPYLAISSMGSALVGNALYFGNAMGNTALKYDVELHQLSFIQLPSLPRGSLLTTKEDGGLGLISRDDSKLCIWSRKDAKWERRLIELRTVFPVDISVTKLGVIGSGVGIVFMRIGNVAYTIDLKTYKVKKVCEGTAQSILPYMGFYTPVLRVATAGERPSAGASTAEQT